MTERQPPDALASELFEHLAEVHGDADADLNLAKVIAEALELSPIAREHICDLILVELIEELHRRGEPGREAARLVGEIQRDWSQA